MAKKRTSKRLPQQYKKPLMLVSIPLFVTALWLAVGFLLVISGLVDGSPSAGDRTLSVEEYESYMALYRRTEFWQTVWLGGLMVIFIGSLISSSVGMLRILQHRQSRRR